MKIAISGASGFVGKALQESLKEHTIIPLGRKEIADPTLLAQKITDCDCVINLAGAPIIARWSESYKKELYHSRIDTTQALVKAMNTLEKKPSCFISTSAVGIYDNRDTYSETNAHYSEDFLSQLCQDWEHEASQAQGVRTVIFRFGIILGKNGGALSQMLTPFRLGLGGKIGSGTQKFSWVHLDDLVQAYQWAITTSHAQGVYNLTAPQPITNAIFTQALAHALGVWAFLPVPEFVLKIIFSEGAKVLTDGQSVVPERLINEGFVFNYPDINTALQQLV